MRGILQSCVDLRMKQMNLFNSVGDVYRAVRCSRIPCTYCKERGVRRCLESVGVTREYARAFDYKPTYEELFNGIS
jgi:hypothetical protein